MAEKVNCQKPKVPLSYQIIPNITLILAILGILLMVIRRLPEAAKNESEPKAEDKLKAKGLPVIALSKVKTWLKFSVKKTWNFILEAKDLRPHAAAGYQMKKIFVEKLPVFNTSAGQKPLTTNEVKNEQYYLDNIRLQPKNFGHYDALGKFYISQENYEDAANTYAYLTGHQPQNPDFHARLAYCYYQQKNYAKAAESYKKSLALDSTQPNRYYNLGLCLEQAGKLQEAATNFEKAASLEPSVKCYLALGSTYQKIGELLKAKEAFTHGQKLDPHNEQIKNKLSKLMAPVVNNHMHK